jgi:hypothetical protein
MRARATSYIIKVFETQWDDLHDKSVKPFFEQLKRDTAAIESRRRGKRPKRPGHDALFSYRVFQNAAGLDAALGRQDRGAASRAKIAYFSCHGYADRLRGAQDISRTQLKNLLAEHPGYEGFHFGACDFVNRRTATQLLRALPSSTWVAGYAGWIPWLESMLCDLMFLRLLLTGRFTRPEVNTRWTPMGRAEDAALALYQSFPPSVDLQFSLFSRAPRGIRSTLEQHAARRARPTARREMTIG